MCACVLLTSCASRRWHYRLANMPIAEYAGNAKVSKYALIADREKCENISLVFTIFGGIAHLAIARRPHPASS